MEDELWARWVADVGPGTDGRRAFDGVCARYREPHRRYHSLTHLTRVLQSVAELATWPGADGVTDLAAVRLAAWYHDAVYDTRSSSNEQDSADLATRELAALGQPPQRIALVRELVLATVDHQTETVSDQLAAAVLLDADLAVLAGSPSVYAAYVDGVRAEYAQVDDETWRAGRTRVLERLLDRPTLFHVPPTSARNSAARANLTAELARWNGGRSR